MENFVSILLKVMKDFDFGFIFIIFVVLFIIFVISIISVYGMLMFLIIKWKLIFDMYVFED